MIYRDGLSQALVAQALGLTTHKVKGWLITPWEELTLQSTTVGWIWNHYSTRCEDSGSRGNLIFLKKNSPKKKFVHLCLKSRYYRGTNPWRVDSGLMDQYVFDLEIQ